MLPTVTRYQALSRGHTATFNDQQKSAHDNSLPPQLLPEKNRSGWATSVRTMSLTWTLLTVVPPTVSDRAVWPSGGGTCRAGLLRHRPTAGLGPSWETSWSFGGFFPCKIIRNRISSRVLTQNSCLSGTDSPSAQMTWLHVAARGLGSGAPDSETENVCVPIPGPSLFPPST